MDKEKVIKGLTKLSTLGIPDCAEESCPFWKVCVDGEGCYFDLFPFVLALLKEQEAKPIVYTDNPYTGLPVARCPKCAKFARQFHSITTEETHYCPWCGQAVKWE